MVDRLKLTRDQIAESFPNQESLRVFEQLLKRVSQILSVPGGGTGQETFPVGGVLIGDGTNPINSIVTVSNESLWGAGAAGIDDDSGFTRTAAGGRYLFGATDDAIGKVQIAGSLNVGGNVYNGGNEIDLVGPLVITSEGSVSLNAVDGGDLSGQAGVAPSANSNGGSVVFTTGDGGATTGDSGGVSLVVGAVVDGDAGQFVLIGADGTAANNLGTGVLLTLGAALTAGFEGEFIVTDTLGSGVMTYSPLNDLLSSGNIQCLLAGGFISSDASPGISTTITSGTLVGKTITVKDGLITGFA